jgi:hypothetical protein
LPCFFAFATLVKMRSLGHMLGAIAFCPYILRKRQTPFATLKLFHYLLGLLKLL